MLGRYPQLETVTGLMFSYYFTVFKLTGLIDVIVRVPIISSLHDVHAHHTTGNIPHSPGRSICSYEISLRPHVGIQECTAASCNYTPQEYHNL